MPIEEARRNDEVIALADGQALRWIDEITGNEDSDARAREVKRQITDIRHQPNSINYVKDRFHIETDNDNIADAICIGYFVCQTIKIESTSEEQE